ncbi:MAG: UDP-N-acetylmuramoyl-tripeptide--D-alanyl-D-alanine ligase [Candidatus Omnitrophota bacterium]
MFTLREILKAAGGELVVGGGRAPVVGVSTDSRAIRPGEAFVALRGTRFDGHKFITAAIDKGAAAIVFDRRHCLGPGGALLRRLQRKTGGRGVAFIGVKDTLRALGDIAAFHRRRFSLPLIAVTGSCGKTTTKDMIYVLLSGRFNILKNEGTYNNLVGLPQTLLRLDGRIEAAVVELGAGRPGDIKRLARICRPNIGIITNIGPAHLEFLGSPQRVGREKRALLTMLQPPKLAIVNGDDELLRIRRAGSRTVWTFGAGPGRDFTFSGIRQTFGGTTFLLGHRHRFRLKALGRHNVYNAAAALACGFALGVGVKEMQERLARFIPSCGRLKLRRIRVPGKGRGRGGSVCILDDSYNANPLSLSRAIGTLAELPVCGRRICVIGDMLELGKGSLSWHRQLADKVVSCGAQILITVGKLSKEAFAAAARGKKSIRVYHCACARQAGKVLFGLAQPGDLVLIKGSRAMEMERVVGVG